MEWGKHMREFDVEHGRGQSQDGDTFIIALHDVGRVEAEESDDGRTEHIIWKEEPIFPTLDDLKGRQARFKRKTPEFQRFPDVM